MQSEYLVTRKWVRMLEAWGGTLICISGASGSGKTSLADKLPYPVVPSITTREARINEKFSTSVSAESFNKIMKANGFGTIIQYPNNLYGIKLNDFYKLSRNHQTLIMVVSPVMYKRIRKFYENTVGIYIEVNEQTALCRQYNRDGHLEEGRIASIQNNVRFKNLYPIQVQNENSLKLTTLRAYFKLKVYQMRRKTRNWLPEFLTKGLKKRNVLRNKCN